MLWRARMHTHVYTHTYTHTCIINKCNKVSLRKGLWAKGKLSHFSFYKIIDILRTTLKNNLKIIALFLVIIATETKKYLEIILRKCVKISRPLWWGIVCLLALSALRRQGPMQAQVQFQCTVSSKPARATQRDSVSKKHKGEKSFKEKSHSSYLEKFKPPKDVDSH